MQYAILRIILLSILGNGICSIPFFRTDHHKITKAIISVTPTSQLEISNNISWTRLPTDGSYAYNAPAIPIMGSLVEPSYNIANTSHTIRPSIYGCPVHRNINKDKTLSLVYKPPSQSDRWVALVAEGRCMLRDKINLAYHSGAVGLMFYNPRRNHAQPRPIYVRRNDFVVVGTSLVNYRNMSEQLSSGVTIRINPGDTHYPIHVGYVGLLCLVLFVLSIILCCYGIHCPCPIKINIPNIPDRINYWSTSTTTKLEALDVCLYDITSCCICLEEFESGSIVTRLPCQHQFHKNCIRDWVTGPQFANWHGLSDPTCPICYKNIFPLKFTGTRV